MRKPQPKPSKGAAGEEALAFDEAASTLGVSRSTLTRWVGEGRVRGSKVGRRWRFRRSDLEKVGQMAHPSAAAVNVAELDAVTASLSIPAIPDDGISTDPALPNYPTAEEEVAVERLFRALLLNAVSVGASDVHVEAGQEGCIIRTRIDGVLHETARLPRSAHKALATCIKYHADMPVDQPAVNHDGIFRLKVKDQSHHVRVATVPAIYGDSVVMRILAQPYQVGGLEWIGMRDADKERYLRALRAPCGLVLLSGPTGSGKTTVMYAGLQQIVNPEIKTLAVEDPVIAVLPWVTQVPVNRKAGMTFEHVLRAFMRQDPDVIVVGAINSLAVAEGCLHAAITGHLVMSTLHAPGAALAISRLLEMGAEPFMVADTLLCVVSTRLARRVCPKCAAPDELPFAVLSPIAERARAGGYMLPDDPRFIRGKGCDNCRGTGYRGRTGIYEVMEVNAEIQRLIASRTHATGKLIQETAVRNGMTTLAADALRKAAEGITSVAEAARVTYTAEG
jgi:type IV pilus assembly protein PilB